MNLDRIYENWERKTLAKGRAEGKAEGKAQGKAQGKAEALLAVLAARGLPATPADRKRVLACTDGEQLDAWLRAAVTAPSVKALLSGQPGGHAPASRPTRPAARLPRTPVT